MNDINDASHEPTEEAGKSKINIGVTSLIFKNESISKSAVKKVD